MVNCLNRISESGKNVRFGSSATVVVNAVKKNTPDLSGSSVSEYLKSLDPTYSQQILCKMPWLVRWLNSVKNWMGEFGSTCVNAFGTGLIAPIFIAWNPISKADEKTKKYSALRQPLSAVLAVLTSAAVTIPFNKLVENLADQGLLANTINRTFVRSDRCIRRDIKSRFPNKTKQEIDRMFLRAKQDEYLEAFNYLKEQGTLDGLKGMSMSSKERRELVLKTLHDLEEEVSKDIGTYRDKVYPKYKDRLMYYFKKPKNTDQYFAELRQYFDSSEVKSKSDAKSFYNAIKRKYSDKELKEVTAEISSCKTKEEQKNLFRKILRYRDIVSGCKSEADIDAFLNADKAKKVGPLERIELFMKKAQESFKACAEEDIPEFIREYTRKGLELNNDKAFNKNLMFEIVKKEVANAENRFKSYKNITGLILGMLTIPVSCTILNWLYPRFVELFFPSLCSDDSEEKTPKKSVRGAKA